MGNCYDKGRREQPMSDPFAGRQVERRPSQEPQGQYSRNLNKNVSRAAQVRPQAQVQMPAEIYVRVQPPGHTECTGRYAFSGERQWRSSTGMLVYTDQGGYWLIGNDSLMRKGQGWFATHRPHGGRPPTDPALKWSYVRKGGTHWEAEAPISFATSPRSSTDGSGYDVNPPQENERKRLPPAAPAEPASRNDRPIFVRLSKGASSVSLADFRAAVQADPTLAAELGVPQGAARDYFYAITNGDAALTSAKLRVYMQLKVWIPRIDSRNTGMIGAWDLEVALRKYVELQDLLGVQPHLAQSFMRQLDTEGTGQTKVLDFIKWCSATDAQKRPEHSGQTGGARIIKRLESVHGSGARVSETDVKNVLQADRAAQLELGWPEHQVPVVFKIIGADRHVSLKALHQFFQLTSLFNRIDSGRDGFIDAWEFGHALSNDAGLQAELRTSLSDAQSVFRSIDSNQHGTVSFLEFYRHFRADHDKPKRRVPQAAKPVAAPQYQYPEDAYLMKKKLGEGCYGVVYLANRRSDGLQLIIKKPKMIPGFDMEDVRREAELMRRVKHPHIVRFVEAFKDKSGALLIVTEFADGGDLRKKLLQFPRGLPNNTALTWFAQTLAAVKYLHERNIMHRDIKPDNIFLTSGGSVKLGDLGLAKQLRPSARGAVTHTVFRGPRGLPSYMAPEQHRGQEHSVKIDVWSLGCVLYEMATGRVCFSSPEAAAQAQGPPQGAPSYCAQLLRQILVPDQYHRPSAAEVLRMLGEHGHAVADVGCMATYTRDRRQRHEPQGGGVALMNPNDIF